MVALNRIGRPTYRLYQFAWAGLDWIYPPHCGGCGKPFTRFCAACREKIRFLEEPVCEKCGGVLTDRGCASCRVMEPPYAALRSCVRYEGPLRNLILRLKYHGDLALGEIMARWMIDRLLELKWEVDLILPVPGSLARQKMRGYNQASLLAFPIALYFGLPYHASGLTKTRDTPSQVGLTAEARRKNVKGAFSADRRLTADRRVLVIDDVVTSGATMETCAQALLDQGASRVYGLTLARAGL